MRDYRTLEPVMAGMSSDSSAFVWRAHTMINLLFSTPFNLPFLILASTGINS